MRLFIGLHSLYIYVNEYASIDRGTRKLIELNSLF